MTLANTAEKCKKKRYHIPQTVIIILEGVFNKMDATYKVEGSTHDVKNQ